MIMQGATYRNLPTEKQRIAADKFASWRPIFKEELEALTEGQTSDYVVTGEDIHSIIPKVKHCNLSYCVLSSMLVLFTSWVERYG